MATIVTQEASPAWSGSRLARLKRRSQEIFEQMTTMPGVQGACLCDNQGAILGMLLTATGDRRLFERIGFALTQCLAALSRPSPLKNIELRFERKLVIARDLGNALVVVLCSTETSAPVLRMALEVAANPFEGDADLQRDLRQVAPSRSSTLGREHLDASARHLLLKAGVKGS
jgi:hypothetical protein